MCLWFCQLPVFSNEMLENWILILVFLSLNAYVGLAESGMFIFFKKMNIKKCLS